MTLRFLAAAVAVGTFCCSYLIWITGENKRANFFWSGHCVAFSPSYHPPKHHLACDYHHQILLSDTSCTRYDERPTIFYLCNDVIHKCLSLREEKDPKNSHASETKRESKDEVQSPGAGRNSE